MTDDDLAARGKALAESGKYRAALTLVAASETGENREDDGDQHLAVDGTEPDNGIDGASFVLDRPAGIPAIWGRSTQVLWPRGEALMIAGGQGLGKTTLAGLLLKGLLGLQTNVLGLPVHDFGCRVLYLAMDRPSQISRSLGRQFSAEHRDVLRDRVTFWKGPPPRDLAANPALLAKMANFYGAGVVIVDSLKDAAVRLSEDAVGAQWNRARQHLLAQGCQLLELHHSTKRGPAGAPISGVADVYGSTRLTSGCGSIILLAGEPGDPIVSFRHVKQPAEEVGPYQLLHDQNAGHLAIDFQVDLIDLVTHKGVDGLTAKDAAVVITGKDNPSAADTEKARRRLNQKVDAGLLIRVDGGAKRPAPPPELGTSGRRCWRDITEMYEFEKSELLVLTEICRTVDRLDALNAAVAERGVVDEGSQGMRASPLLVEERQQRMLLSKLIVGLGLPLGTIEGATKGTTPVRGIYSISG